MKAYWHKLLRDRLVWFVAAGLVLFAIDGLARQRDNQRILIDLPLVEKLVAQWEGQTKRRPNGRELDALIEGYIREEILVREARRMGLDDNDIIVRRRLAQKVEFFMADNNPPDLPDLAALKAWFEENRAAYDAPPRLSWRHVFAADEARAATLRTQLQADDKDWRQMGQPFMLNRAYARQTQTELAQLMGGDFAARLMGEKQEGWLGPIRSAYGWHVVHITARQAAQKAAFDPLVEKIAKDWQDAQTRLSKQAAWEKLRASYHIEMAPVE